MRRNTGQTHDRARCPDCGRAVATRNGRIMYHYAEPRGPKNPHGLACSGQGKRGAPTPDLSPAEAATVARLEAAPDAEESLRERVARAMHRSDFPGSEWESDDFWHSLYRDRATVALAVMRGES